MFNINRGRRAAVVVLSAQRTRMHPHRDGVLVARPVVVMRAAAAAEGKGMEGAINQVTRARRGRKRAAIAKRIRILPSRNYTFAPPNRQEIQVMISDQSVRHQRLPSRVTLNRLVEDCKVLSICRQVVLAALRTIFVAIMPTI